MFTHRNRSSSRGHGEDREGPRKGYLLAGASAFAVVLALVAVNLQPTGPSTAEAAPSNKYRKIVALTPFAANAMAQMGVFPEALGQTLGGDRRYVSGLRSTPKIEMSHPDGPNMEQLVKYSPDLIFSSPQWSSGKPLMEDIVGDKGRVENADPKSIRSSYQTVQRIAKLVGRKARGKRLVLQMKKSVGRSTKGVSGRRGVMLILGVGETPWVFLPDSWGGEIVRKAGGRLKTAGASGRGLARISNEIVVAENPETIIAVPHGDSKVITSDLKKKLREQWAGSRAADTGRIYFSVDNSLLQAGTDIGRTIRKVSRLLGTG